MQSQVLRFVVLRNDVRRSHNHQLFSRLISSCTTCSCHHTRSGTNFLSFDHRQQLQQQHHHHQQQQRLIIQRFLSTTTTPSSSSSSTSSLTSSASVEDPQGIIGTTTLDGHQTSLPVLDSDNAGQSLKDIIARVENIVAATKKGNPETVELVVNLLDQLSQQVEHVVVVPKKSSSHDDNDNEGHQISNYEFSIPNDLLYKVITSWEDCTKEKSTDVLSPRDVFHRVQTWNLPFQKRESFLATYDTIINVAAKLQDPELADEILDYILMLEPTQGNDGSHDAHVPDVTFHTVIDAWVKRASGGTDALERAEAVLQKMANTSVPTFTAYSTVVSAWTRSNHEQAPHRAALLLCEIQRRGLFPPSYDGDRQQLAASTPPLNAFARWAKMCRNELTPHRAHAILDQLIDLYLNQGNVDARPNANCFLTVISAYINSGNLLRAENLLMEMIEKFQTTGDRLFFPNHFCFNVVIHAWSQSGAPGSAERVLQRMADLAKVTGDKSIEPDVISYKSVLGGWARSKDDDNAPEQCAQLIRRMREAGCEPDLFSIHLWLNCWANATNKEEAPQSAEKILRYILDLNESGNTTVKANAITYNIVMKCWARSSRSDAAVRTQALFDELIEKYDNSGGDVELKPSVHSFGTLITAWGRSRHRDRGAKAQAVFDDLLDRYKRGDAKLKPNITHWTALMDAWAKADHPERATRLLHEIESDRSAGVKPTNVSYLTVINGWSSSSRPDAAEQAQAVFDRMLEQRIVQPNLLVYSALIKAWSRRRSKDGAVKAQAIFDALLDRYHGGGGENANLRPNVTVCNAVIDAWAKVGLPLRAENMLRRMESLWVKPDACSYSSVMNAWAQSSHVNAADRVQALFDELQAKYESAASATGSPIYVNHRARALKPNIIVYGTLMKAWGRTESKNGARKAQAIFDDMFVRYLSGNKDLKPDVNLYSNLINAWAVAGEPDIAEKILREMESPTPFPHLHQKVLLEQQQQQQQQQKQKQHRSGYSSHSVEPNVVTYNSVVKAWSLSPRADGAQRAQDLYHEMLGRASVNSDGSGSGSGSGNHHHAQPFQPDVMTYDTLISGWLRRNDPVKAKQLYDDMMVASRSYPTYFANNKWKPTIDRLNATFQKQK